MSRSARRLAESSRFEAIRDSVAPAYALGDLVSGHRVRYPHALNGYKWLFQHVARADMIEQDEDAPDRLELDGAAPSCPSRRDLGRIDVCVLHPEAADLVAVQLGESDDTWYLVSADYFRAKSAAAHGGP